jgi:hypothetical protein
MAVAIGDKDQQAYRLPDPPEEAGSSTSEGGRANGLTFLSMFVTPDTALNML